MKNTLNSPTDGHRIWNESKMMNCNHPNSNPIKQNENKYSRNDMINNYINSSEERNQNISRDNLAMLPSEYQIAVFRSLSNENKIRIFKEKIELVINSERLSQLEINHLKSTLAFIKPSYYNPEFEEKVSSFYENWKKVAMSNFNWSEMRTEMYVETWFTEHELSNNRITAMYIGAAQQYCACRSD